MVFAQYEIDGLANDKQRSTKQKSGLSVKDEKFQCSFKT